MQIITELSKTIKARLKADPKNPMLRYYTTRDSINPEKISEESTEVILAAKDTVEPKNDKEHVTEEVADLWFHCMVLLTHLDIEPEDVLKILENRFGEGGLVEKAKKNLSEITL